MLIRTLLTINLLLHKIYCQNPKKGSIWMCTNHALFVKKLFIKIIKKNLTNVLLCANLDNIKNDVL